MKKTETSIDGAYVIQVEKFGDDRGFFMETFLWGAGWIAGR